MKNIIKTLLLVSFASISSFAQAQDQAAPETSVPEVEANNLDQLLEMVRTGVVGETAQHRAREAEFVAQRNKQNQLLQEAKQERTRQENLSERLEATFQSNETTISTLQTRLQERMGSLNELFGVLQQVAGDTRGVFAGSLISVQYPDRNATLDKLIEKAAGGTDLPTIKEIEGLWFELQREMTESGKIVRFNNRVSTADGQAKDVDLVRIGDFNLISGGKFYTYLPSTGRVSELVKQPSGRFLETLADYEATPTGSVATLTIDPTRGQLLSILVNSPSTSDRFHQGGQVGYLIAALGVFGILLVIERFIYLSAVSGRVRKQIRTGEPSEKNPLGRVLKVYHDNKNVGVETLELKLDEAILKETPSLERFLTMIKLISAVAPLFGLLGTVTGMIATFQAITLFGTGDPKLMADGISQALVTTVLGLVVAIPTLLLHSMVAGMSKGIIHVLEEQSAGIIAVHAEKEASNG
ncbi:MAG: MotA/TolQ/ExbB proton channel family protein [Sphingomonadales bacterium]